MRCAFYVLFGILFLLRVLIRLAVTNDHYVYRYYFLRRCGRILHALRTTRPRCFFVAAAARDVVCAARRWRHGQYILCYILISLMTNQANVGHRLLIINIVDARLIDEHHRAAIVATPRVFGR